MKQIWRYRILLWLSLLCMPATLLTGLFLLNTVNPMAMVFLTDFQISNASGETLLVTPVGTAGKRGYRHTLPLSLSSFLSIPSPFDRSFSLRAGQRRSFTYDWDDIQFSEILVMPAAGEPREVVVDSSPTENQYRRASTNHFVIPPLAQLPVARPEVRAVLNQPDRGVRLWGIALFGLLPPMGFAYSLCLRRRQRQASES